MSRTYIVNTQGWFKTHVLRLGRQDKYSGALSFIFRVGCKHYYERSVVYMITLTLLVLAILIFLIVLICCGWAVIIPMLDIIIAILVIVLIVKSIKKCNKCKHKKDDK